MESVDKFFLYFPLSPLVAISGVIFALVIYPTEERWTIDRGDTAAILGSAVGVNIGSWFYPSPDNIIMGPFPVRPGLCLCSLTISTYPGSDYEIVYI